MEMKSILAVPFNTNNYNNFILEFFNEIDKVAYKEIKPNSTFANAIDYYSVHGTYRDPDGNDIIVLSVKVKNNSNARQAQRNFVSYLLTNDFNQYSAAMVAYYDDVRTNWKLSFVTVEMELGDNGIELKFKPAKRFSFLVGENEPTRTYTQQLGPVYTSRENPTLDRITEAFSVNKLSKDFYEDYKKKFFELVDYLEKDSSFKNEAHRLGYENSKKFAITFAKKTLGQMVFLHFIQKKGWLGVHEKWGDGSQTYLIDSTKGYGDKNYFNDFLEPLFYCALNKKRDNDMYLNSKIPFLNGGLFNPIEHYNWQKTDFDIPNDYWFNSDETGLLDILSQYNFTVDEADPTEQEVAVDPEMLGKIFESLLDVNDRASLGAFYTPREIVHYMCEESLAERIAKILTIDYQSILNFIRYGDALVDTDFIMGFADEIDDIVSNISIVDPAVGSGAFLVGMLNQIVKLRTNLNIFTKKELSKYEIKLKAIQKSLYGVDIEYDAIEIAKLRLWLSLIVDQETHNYAPRPLPNLNFNLRVGNSLVDSFEGIKLWNSKWRGSKKKVKQTGQMNLFNVDAVNVILNALKEAKLKFFSTSDENEKNYLLREIEHQQMELIRSELVAKGDFDIYQKVEEMIKKKTKPFFIWELEFEQVFENGGFDIVIANPPYVGEDGNKNVFEPIKSSSLGKRFYQGKMDLLYFFFHLAIDISKENSTLCFITTNYYVTATGGVKLRKDLKERTHFSKIINFNDLKIFDSALGQHNMISILTHSVSESEYECDIYDVNINGHLSQFNNLMENLNNHEDIKYFRCNSNSLYYGEMNCIVNKKKYSEGSEEECIINLLLKSSSKLSDYCNVNQGIVPGAIKNTKKYFEANTNKTVLNQGIFVLDISNPEDRMLINKLTDNEKKIIKPYFKNSDIYKYGVNEEVTKYILYIDNKGIKEKEYPNIYSHLKLFDNFLRERIVKHNESYHWTSLHRSRNIDVFLGEKILVPYRCSDTKFGYTVNPWFFSTDCYSIKLKDGADINLKYLLGLLNSSIYKVWFINRGKTKGTALEFMSSMMAELPIIRLSSEDEMRIVGNVDKLLNTDYILIQDIYDNPIFLEIDNIIRKYL